MNQLYVQILHIRKMYNDDSSPKCPLEKKINGTGRDTGSSRSLTADHFMLYR